MAKKNNQAERNAPVLRTLPTLDDDNTEYGGIDRVTRAHLNTIEEYCIAMAPGVPMTETNGAHWQRALYRAMMSIIENQDVEAMFAGCDELIKIFKRERKGALNFEYTQRFVDVIKMDTRDLDVYTTLCLFFSTFCTPEDIKLSGQFFSLNTSQQPWSYLQTDVRERLSYYFDMLKK